MDRLKRLSTYDMKVIGMISMAADHFAAVFLGEGFLYTVMRSIGRLAFPIYAFLLVKGAERTKDRGKYLLRLFLLSLVSEIPYDLLFFGKVDFRHQSVLFTLSACLLGLIVKRTIEKRLGERFYGLLQTAAGFLTSLILCSVLKAEYSLLGPILVAVYGYFKGNDMLCAAVSAVSSGYLQQKYLFAASISAAFPPVFHSGRKGRDIRLFSYVFYPGHIIILLIIKTFV